MLRFIRCWFSSWFPIRVDFIEEFAEIIKKERCIDVEAKGFRTRIGCLIFIINRAVKKIGLFEYYIRLTSVIPGYKLVVYTELLNESFEKTDDISDAIEGEKLSIRTFITVEERLKELVAVLKPYIVEIHLEISSGKLSHELLETVHQGAKRLGLKPF